VNVGAGQSFEVHGGGQSLLEVGANWVVASASLLVLADLRLTSGSGGAASVSVAAGGELSLLRVAVESGGAVSFSGSVSVTECVLTGVDLVGSMATAVLRVSGGMLTGSTVSLSDGSAVLGDSCVLVNSPVSIAAGTMSVSACELQSDGSSVPLAVESGGSSAVTGTVFRSTAGDITVISVSDGGNLTASDSQMIAVDGSSDPFPCDGTLPTCTGAHAGSVTVAGPTVITLVSPLVCDTGTGECLSDLCFVVDCGVGGTCVSPHGTCTCSNGYSGARCETHTCCSAYYGGCGTNDFQCCGHGAGACTQGTNVPPLYSWRNCVCTGGLSLPPTSGCQEHGGSCDENVPGWDDECDRDC
jgi:hypothetical protein